MIQQKNYIQQLITYLLLICNRLLYIYKLKNKLMKGGETMSKKARLIIAVVALTLGVVATAGKATRDKSMWGFLNGVSICDKSMWG